MRQKNANKITVFCLTSFNPFIWFLFRFCRCQFEFYLYDNRCQDVYTFSNSNWNNQGDCDCVEKHLIRVKCWEDFIVIFFGPPFYGIFFIIISVVVFIKNSENDFVQGNTESMSARKEDEKKLVYVEKKLLFTLWRFSWRFAIYIYIYNTHSITNKMETIHNEMISEKRNCQQSK